MERVTSPKEALRGLGFVGSGLDIGRSKWEQTTFKE
jgi:hypothetical protein